MPMDDALRRQLQRCEHHCGSRRLQAMLQLTMSHVHCNGRLWQQHCEPDDC